MTTAKGLAIAIQAVQNHPNNQIALWSAIPCTGGSPWQYVNEAIYTRRGDHVKLQKLHQHRTLFRSLFTNFEILADIVIGRGGVVCIEWPTPCKYWRDPQVLAFTRKHNFVKTQLHGCAYGLQNRKGNPMKKPWSICTNSHSVATRLTWKCDGTHKHEEARGIDCKLSEGYTDMLAQEVHSALAHAFVSPVSSPASATLPRRSTRPAAAAILLSADSGATRPRQRCGPASLLYSISSAPRCRSPSDLHFSENQVCTHFKCGQPVSTAHMISCLLQFA